MIDFTATELQGHESLKNFESVDDLGKAYAELHGKATSGSIDLLPEDIRKDGTISNYKTSHDIAKALIETKKLVGTIKRPPETPDGYKFSNLEGLNPKVKVSPEFQKWYATEAHKIGLSNDQADGVNKLMFGYLSNVLTKNEQAEEEGFKTNDATLKQEWGDKYDEKTQKVKNMFMKIGGQELVDRLGIGQKLSNVPMATKGFAKIADLLSEDSLSSLGMSNLNPQQENDEKTFNDLAEAIRVNDPKHPINDIKSADHDKAVQEWGRIGGKYKVKK